MKSFFRFLGAFSALLLVTITGCLDIEFLTFAHPSVAPEDAEVQTELFGSYIVTDPPKSQVRIEKRLDLLVKEDSSPPSPHLRILHVGRAGEGFPAGFLRFVDVSNDRKGKLGVSDSGEPYFASKVGDCYILNMPVEKPAEGEEEDLLLDDEVVTARVTEWKPENYEGYFLIFLKPTKTGFSCHILDEDFIKAEIAAGRLSGKFMTRQQKEEYEQKRKAAKRAGKKFDDERTPFLVTAKPPELQAFFDKNVEKIAGDPFMFLKRVK